MDKRPPTILSFAVRASRYGYAVFAGPEKLLDWGAGEIVSHETGNAVGVRRAEFLFGHFRPDVVILSRSPRVLSGNYPRAGDLIQSITRESALGDARLVSLDWEAITSVFAASGPSTRYEIASALARTFPDLHWKLPPKPKSTDREPHILIAFDAVAGAVAGSFPDVSHPLLVSEGDPTPIAL